MKIIAQCQHCKRRYNATGHNPGVRFRCQCNEIVEVPKPESGRNADVVRCSSCGGARSNKATECEFCSSAFTMHDYDLNTVYHNCFTRVSDKAKYCHSCGTGIATEDNIGNITDKACPACGPDHFLHTRQFRPDHPAVLECNHCVGIWLTNDYFEKVIKDSLTAGENAIKPDDVKPHKLEVCSDQTSFHYRKCPDCNQFMARENFARRSGMIVDSCRQHGRWFDAEELARILTWVEAGGMIKSSKANLVEEQAKLREAKRQLAREKETSAYDIRINSRGSIGVTLLDLLF